jgi:hypothetical protein
MWRARVTKRWFGKAVAPTARSEAAVVVPGRASVQVDEDGLPYEEGV